MASLSKEGQLANACINKTQLEAFQATSWVLVCALATDFRFIQVVSH